MKPSTNDILTRVRSLVNKLTHPTFKFRSLDNLINKFVDPILIASNIQLKSTICITLVAEGILKTLNTYGASFPKDDPKEIDYIVKLLKLIKIINQLNSVMQTESMNIFSHLLDLLYSHKTSDDLDSTLSNYLNEVINFNFNSIYFSNIYY